MRQRNFLYLFAAVVLVTSPLTACNIPSQTQGPTTWIDRPLDGAQVPLASLTILAHASDLDGVATIEFSVSDSLIASVPAGGGRLGEASIEWLPPGTGVYLIGAQAIDTQGNVGSKSTSKISVGEHGGQTDTPTPAPMVGISTSTPTPTIGISTSTPTPTAKLTGPSLSLIQNANCRTGPGIAYEAIETLLRVRQCPLRVETKRANGSG